MANRQMYQFRYQLEANPVDLFMKVNIGSTGAPTLVSGQNKGITSIVRNSAGKYTITLVDKYNRLLAASLSEIVSTGAPAAPVAYVVSDGSASSTPTIVIQYANTSGTATDPASGEVLLLSFTLKNSSI